MNRTTIIIAAGLLALSVGLGLFSGCDLGDFVTVRTPFAVQQSTGLPAKTTLNEAEAEYQAYFSDTSRQLVQWKKSIEQGREMRGMLGQLTMNYFDGIGPTLAGIPVLGPAVPGLVGILGLMFGRGNLRKHKEASFNKGLEKGKVTP